MQRNRGSITFREFGNGIVPASDGGSLAYLAWSVSFPNVAVSFGSLAATQRIPQHRNIAFSSDLNRLTPWSSSAGTATSNATSRLSDGVDVDGLLIWSLSPTLRETRRLTSREQMAMER